MAIARTNLHIGVNVDGAAKAAAELSTLEKRMASLNKLGNGAGALGAMGMGVQGFNVKVDSQIRSMDELAKKIQKGTISQREYKRAIAGTNSMLEYQRRVSNLTIGDLKTLKNGQILVEFQQGLRGTSAQMVDNATKLRTLGATYDAFGQSIANTGKNMAFMGRQMLLSLTAPIALAAGGSAAVFYQYDKQLTNLVKLMGDSRDEFSASSAAIREDAMELSKTLNETMGVSVKDSLDLQGTFAALGKSGKELENATKSASRAMVLGDIGSDQAIKMGNTMQAVFQASEEKVNEYIDLINEFENSTVLATEDVADALPKIAPIVKSMGGDVEDALVLLESLKRGGIDAVEGANAVKSITGSIFRPTKKLQLMYQEMVPGDSLAELIKRNGNKIIDIVKDLGDITKDWQPDKKLKLFYQLAGKEQAARMIQLADNLAVGNDRVTETLAKSAAERRAIAEKEINDIMASASKQFDVQLQRAMLFLSEVGGKVLPIITKGFSMLLTAIEEVTESFGNFLDFLGPIGDLIGFITKGAIGLAAALGPVILALASLSLAKGMAYKGIGKAMGFVGGKMGGKFLTAEQKAQQIAQEQMDAAQKESIATTKALEVAIMKLTGSYDKMTVAATGAANATKRVALSAKDSAALAANPALMPFRDTSLTGVTGTLRSDEARLRKAISDDQINRLNSQVSLIGAPTPQRKVGGATHEVGDSITRAAAAQEKAAASAQKWATGLGAVAGSAGLLTSVLGGTNAMIQTISTALFALSTLALFPAAGGFVKKMFNPILKGGRLAFEAIGMIGTNVFMNDVPNAAAKGTSKIGRLFAGIGPKIAGAAKAFGPWGIAIAGVAAAVYGLNKLIMRGAEQHLDMMNKINSSAKEYADILGYTYKEIGQTVNEAGELEETVESLAKKFKDNEIISGGVLEALKNASGDVESMSLILTQESVKILARGGTEADVKKMVEAALQAAGADSVDMGVLKARFSDIDVINADLLGQQMMDQLREGFGGQSENATFMDVMKDRLNPFNGVKYESGVGDSAFSSNDLSRDAEAKAKQMGQTFVNAFAAADDETKFKLASQWSNTMREAMKEAVDSGDEGAIETAKKFQQAVIDSMAEEHPKLEMFDKEEYQNIAQDFDTVMASINKSTISGAQATTDYNAAIGRLKKSNIDLTQAEKVRLLNIYRIRAGMDELSEKNAAVVLATENDEGFIDSVGRAGFAVDNMALIAEDATGAVEGLDDAMGEGQEVDWALNFTINAGALGMNGDPSEMIDLTLQGYKDAMSKAQSDVFDTAARIGQEQFDARMKELENQRDAALDALDKESKALDERFEAEEKAMSKAQDAEKKSFDDGWEARMEAEKAAYDARVKAIEDVQEKEDELERQRQRNTEREAARLRYLSGLMNNNIDMNAAIASGDLDQAAKLAINQAQSATDFQTETADREAGWRKEDDDRARGNAIDLIRQEEEERMKMLERQKEQERLAMEQRHEIQREEFQRRRDLERADLEAKRAALQQEWQMKLDNERSMYEINKRRMEDELNTLRATLPRTNEEMMKQKGQIEAIYAQYGVQLQQTGDEWASIVGNRLTVRVKEAQAAMSNDRDWELFGTRVSEGVSRGAFNMSSGEFNHFLRTGEMPGTPPARHNGGPISGGRSGDKYDSRGGIPRGAPMQRGERMVLAQDGEFMINKKAHSQLGTGFLNDLNKGVYTRHEGGPIGDEVSSRHDGGPIGLGVMGAAMQAAMIGGLVSRAGLAMGNAMMSAVQSGLTSGGFIGEGAAKAAQDFARGETGKPYQYAGVGNPSWDCSGFMGAIWAILTGKNPMQRHFSTETFNGAPDGTLGFKRGLAPDFPNGFSIGLMHGGGGPNSHMAGTLLGLPVEAGGNGVGMGAGYAGANDPQFNDFWHLPGVGGKRPEPANGGGDKRNWVGWSTPGIEKYGQIAMDRFGYRPGAGAAMGEMLSGNSEFYAKEIVDEAKRRRLSKNAAIIALMTASQESSMLMHANHAVPESLRFPYDRIGDDHDSIGLFQQRPSMGWGSVAQLMNPRASAGIFYNALTKFNYEGMAKGAAAQHVQRSAHPSLYDDDEPRATSWANRYFDMGGLAVGKGLLTKGIVDPERVLSPRQTVAFEKMVPIMDAFANKGIVRYDDIVTSLRNDNGVLNASARGSVLAGPAEGTKYEINITLAGPINGIDDVEQAAEDMANKIMQKIEEKERMKRRRLGGS